MPTHAATPYPLAATHSHDLGALVTVTVTALMITTVIIAAGYLTVCWLLPFTTCHHRARRAWRCRHCDGTGMRLRVGRRLLNHLRAAYRHHR